MCSSSHRVAFEIEIVGGLVEQQQVGLGEQNGRERHPHAPAAGKLRAGAPLVLVREAEARQDFGGARGRRMRVDVGEPRLDLGDAMVIALGLGFAPEGGRARCRPRAPRRCRLSLPAGASCRQTPDAGARRNLDAAALRTDLARDQAEQRRLAGAVSADQPDARAIGNHRRGAVDQKAPGDAHGEVVDRQHAALFEGGGQGRQAEMPAKDAPVGAGRRVRSRHSGVLRSHGLLVAGHPGKTTI